MTYQPTPGQAECKPCVHSDEEYRACPANSVQQDICKPNEFVQRGTQKCVKCPTLGPEKEAECHNGVLKMKNGFWSSALPVGLETVSSL